jgi:chemotaxis methyl-accepting protein methylase/HPt (histidine-containing phosphotransfer) domain-containing protein
MKFSKEIINQFVIESKEYLGTLDDDLRDLEKHKNNPDPTLLNKVFRIHHTIKEGAGFLGLKNIYDLAHIMENMFSIMHAGEIKPEAVIINALLEGADCLNALLDEVEYSNEMDISGVYKHLSNLLSGGVSEQVKKELNTNVALSSLKGENIGFEMNEFTLKYLTAEHKFLYVLKYDLMELSKSENKTPLWLIRQLLGKGIIIEGRLETSLKDLHDGLPLEPLLYEVLYSTSLDSKQMQKTTGLPHNRIIQVNRPSLDTGIHKKNNVSNLDDNLGTVITDVTTDEIPFFKDYHPFNTFRDYILPQIGERMSTTIERIPQVNRKEPKVRIWSVGLSTGQELYSIAILIYEYIKNNHISLSRISVNDFSLLATDESSDALARTIQGEYRDIEISRGPCAGKKSRYFRHEPNGNSWIIHNWIRSMVEFRQISLASPFTFLGNFDVIFCHNVLNSFNNETRREIIQQFFSMLSENGYLFPGTGERLHGITGKFEPIKYGDTIFYEKKDK